MRLSNEQIEVMRVNAMNNATESDTWENETVVSLLDTIEALQQENEQLRAQVARMRDKIEQC